MQTIPWIFVPVMCTYILCTIKGLYILQQSKPLQIPIDLAGLNSLLMSGVELLQKRYEHFGETMSW